MREDHPDRQPRLVVAAHGTASAPGRATLARIVAAVRAERPGLDVGLCFLDVAAPSLRTTLAASTAPTVVLPLLLSAGYHVRTDIPAVVAGRDHVSVAGHLGPDPDIVTALADRLAEARGATQPRTTVLAGVGSSRASAREEVEQAAALLSARVNRPVSVLALTGDLPARLAGLPAPVEVAVHLIAEGDFVTAVRSAAESVAVVADPIGDHPALVSLALRRYDEALVRDAS
jgi:sirohydrochlorin ferrochelatase